MFRFLLRRHLRRESEEEKALLHISDTPERVYPRIAQLIEKLHPEYIVHTGDLVDNIKLERRPDLKPLYGGGLRKLARILKSSGAELYVVPGNEDDPDILKEYFEGSVVEPGTIVEIEGVRFALGHRLEEVAKLDADFRLYGHNFKVIPRGLNGLRSINVVFLPSKRVVKIGYPPGTDTHRGYKLWRGL
ncbi:metallophosphoesterase family protein [Thermococcus stetteri]|uniref:metallophosphoesterase family protein n=1 Tax=Thermococcus stetteri TaxID=49900 RepID=UPI001AE488B0|nr:metallophosphoesterase [Thermococcus stetteri]MBP1912368.1 putative phosphodiesterase [Thermococcus stetteri]